MGIRHPRGAGFEGGDNPVGVVEHKRQVGGNEARDWHSQEGVLYIYTDMSDTCKYTYVCIQNSVFIHKYKTLIYVYTYIHEYMQVGSCSDAHSLECSWTLTPHLKIHKHNT